MSKNKQESLQVNERTRIVKQWHVSSIKKAMKLVEVNQAKQKAKKMQVQVDVLNKQDENLASYIQMNNAKYARIISQEK